MKIYEIIDEPAQEVQKPAVESWPEFLTRHAVADVAAPLARGVAKIPGNAADLALRINQAVTPENQRLTPEQYEGLKLTPQIQAAEENFAQTYLPEKYLQAQHPIPAFIQKAIEKIPSFAGGTWQSTIARALGSAGGEEFARGAGFGEFGQFVGSALGAGLASGATTPRDLKNLERVNYDAFTKSIPRNAIQASANGSKAYHEALRNENLLPETSEWLGKSLKNIEPLLKRGKGTISEIFDRMKYVNKLIRESAPTKEIKEVLGDISAGLKQDLIDAKKVYTSLDTQGLINGSSISYGLNNLSAIRRFLRKYVNAGSAGAAAAAGAVGQQPLAALGIQPTTLGIATVAGPLARLATETVESSYKSPTIRSHLLGEVVPQITKGSYLGRQQQPKKYKKIYELID